MIAAALALTTVGATAMPPPAVPAEPTAAITANPKPKSHWFARVGVLRAHYNDGARIKTDGHIIPESTVDVTDSTTLVVDVGYDISDDLSVMLTGGIPPSADVIGKGSIAGFGKLGHVRFGPAILTAVYRLPERRGLRPYVGAGGAHLFILKTEDRSFRDLKVKDGNGFVVQAGVEYRLNRKWELFADYKHISLKVHATGLLSGEPLRAKVTLDPDLISAGVKFNFD